MFCAIKEQAKHALRIALQVNKESNIQRARARGLRKNAKKAPTLIVVRRGIVHHNNDEMEEEEEEDEEEKEEGEYVPFYKVVGRGATHQRYERSFRLRNYDCSANDFVREIAGEGENDEIVLPSLKRVAAMLFKEGKCSTSEKLF